MVYIWLSETHHNSAQDFAVSMLTLFVIALILYGLSRL